MERKIFELKKIKTRNYQTKWTTKCKKPQRSSSKIVTSEALQRVTDETLQESHLKIGTFLAPRTKHKILEIKKKNEQQRIMDVRISFQKQNTAIINVLASKLRPVKDFKWWTMTLYRSYVKSGNSLAPHNWEHTRVFTS